MMLLNGFTEPAAYRHGFASIGNFDGVHRGHQVLLRRVAAKARAEGVPAVALTFEPHPAAVLAPQRLPARLTSLERKAELISHCGINTLIAIPPTVDLLKMSPAEFFETIILQEMQASGLTEGPNFCFGRDRQGTIETLVDLGQQHHVDIEIVRPETTGTQLVSSSAIRQALRIGDVTLATDLLGRAHRVTGRVVQGAGRGRQLGFPTANLEHITELLPTEGVYAGVVQIGQQAYRAAVHLGPNPTFAEQRSKLELHLLDFNGNLYGETVHLDFCQRLREIQHFPSPVDLQEQLQRDIQHVRQLPLPVTAT